MVGEMLTNESLKREGKKLFLEILVMLRDGLQKLTVAVM